MPDQPMGQRQMIRKLLEEHGYNKQAVCARFAQAEKDGLVKRNRNSRGFSPEVYAAKVWIDGHRKGQDWIVEYCYRHHIMM